MKNIFWLLLIAPLLVASQKTDRRLESQLREAINGYNGDIGVYIKNLRTGKTVSLNADITNRQHSESTDTRRYNG